MARLRSPQYDAQREFILQTAAGAFAEQGFPMTSMADLARRCGVSKSLLYHYYVNKERLLFDLLNDYTTRLVRIADAAEQQTSEPSECLAELIRRFLKEYESSQSRHMVLLNDLKRLPPAQRRGIVNNQRAVVAVFARTIQRAGGFAAAAPLLKPLTMLLFGMMNWTFTWLKPSKGIGYDEFAELVVRVFGAGMRRLASGDTPTGAHSRKRVTDEAKQFL
jgi:AcrR family transcriptional regulator